MSALIAVALLTQIQVRQEPADWKLVATAHFRVYYPSEELLPRARQFAAWFEEARVRLQEATGHEPPVVNVFLYRSYHDLLRSSFLGKTEPLSARLRRPLLDGRTEPNEFCRPNPRSRALALAEPLRDRVLIHCQASDRWNAWFVRHELAHHVQFEHLYSFRLPSWMIALKDPLIPSWWWEGGADYWAGIFDSRKDQYVRDLARERLYDLQELHTPDILNAYDYIAIYYEGSYFWRFLDEKFGPGTGRKLFEAYDRGLPISMRKPLMAATGNRRQELERAFDEHLSKQWAPLMKDRGVPTDRLTDTRAYYRRRAWGGRWSPDGKRLAWVGDEDVWPELYVDGTGLLGWRRGLDTGLIVSAPSWSPDGKKLAVIEWTLGNRDALLLVGVEGGTETIAFDFDELYDPAWSPDGTRIAFAALKNGTSDLYVLHLHDRRVERLTDDEGADSFPAWSPDGRLAFVKETEGRTRLHIQGQGAVTRSWALLEAPQWTPDGKSIVVAADVDGVWDAFSVDPATGAARRLTRFRGGVSYPQLHPDGSLVITYYEARGQDLFRVRPVPQDEPGFDQESRQPWYDQFRKPAPVGEPAEKSRVWGVNWAMFPVTSTSLLLPGAELVIGDRDAENHLTLLASGVSSRYWTAGALVTNTRWRPTLGAAAGASHFDDLYEWRVEPFIEYPLLPTLTTGAGWVGRNRTEIEDDLPDPDFTDSGPSFSLLFSNQAGYQYRDPAFGFACGGTGAWYRDDLGGDRDLSEYYAFAETSYAVSQDWIVWARATYEKKAGRAFLESELLEIDRGVRGAEDFEGTDLGVVSLELRFPLWRDLLWKPFAFMGAGEFLIIKDLRGFVFGQAGYVGARFDDAFDGDLGAVSAGGGLRIDLSTMPWPIVNGRVPLRLELWAAWVGQDGRAPDGAAGVGIQLGF